MYQLLTFVLVFATSVHLSAQTYYYVATNGSDTNNGTSAATPWRTIQKACNSATAGSTVYIKGGVYTEKLNMNVSGTLTNPITFRGGDDGTVTLDGAGVSGTILLKIRNKSYLVVEGIHFTNCIGNDSQGILVDGTSHHITLRNNRISNVHFSANPNATATSNTNSQPLIVYGNTNTPITDLLIEGNEVFDSRTGYSEGLAVNGNVDGFLITHNLVHDLTNIGIDVIGHEGVCPTAALDQARNGTVSHNRVWRCSSPYAAAAGIYTDGARDVVIENNDISHGQFGISIGCENAGKTSSGIIARNNIIYRNAISCLDMGGYEYPSTGKVTNSQFYNNSCFLNDTTGSFSGELFISYTENCQLFNNLLVVTNQGALGTRYLNSVGLQLDYNLYYSQTGAANANWDWGGNYIAGFENYRTQTGQDAHSMFVNPQLVSVLPQLPDLHLSCTSPARDAGNPNLSHAVNETDLDGEARTIGTQTDIGADELPASSTLSISGNNQLCSTDLTQTYTTNTISGASYNWVVSNGSIVSGQGTPTVVVQWNNVAAASIYLELTTP